MGFAGCWGALACPEWCTPPRPPLFPCSQITALKQLQELLLQKDPHLLPEFLPEVASFQARVFCQGTLAILLWRAPPSHLQADQAANVRKACVEFMEATALHRPDEVTMPQCCDVLVYLFADTSGPVAKRALTAAVVCLRMSLAVLGSRGTRPQGDSEQARGLSIRIRVTPPADAGRPSPQVKRCWAAVSLVMSAGRAAMRDKSRNDGVKIQAAKLLEQAVLMLSDAQPPSVPGLTGTWRGNTAVDTAQLTALAEESVEDIITALQRCVGRAGGGLPALPPAPGNASPPVQERALGHGQDCADQRPRRDSQGTRPPAGSNRPCALWDWKGGHAGGPRP